MTAAPTAPEPAGPEPLARRLYAGPAFRDFGVETVVKFGGSLLRDVAGAGRVAEAIGGLPPDRTPLVFPGGGPTDKVIEGIARQVGLDGPTINPACMRALDQTGILLAALHPRLAAVETLADARDALATGRVPVLLPSRLILALDVFTRADVITSDSLGAWFAFVVGAARYVVLTDVDGVYESLDGGPDAARLLRSVTAAELTARGATSVDRCLAPFLSAVGMPAWVLNGRHPDRLVALLDGGEPVGTRIAP